MGGTSPPQDRSVELAAQQNQEAQRIRDEQQRRDEEQRTRFESNLGSAYTTGIDAARNYFGSQGLDANDYIGQITRGADAARTRVPDLAGDPGSYFSNLGEQIFQQEQDAERARNQRGFDTFAREGFAQRRIGNDVDDPFLEGILQEQRSDADDYVRRLLDRGVITNTGYRAAIDDLDSQRPGANVRLQDVGLAELERGRGDLRDIASSGRSAASQARLGDQFDPFQYQGDIDKSQSEFFAGLGDNLRAVAPQNLFDTSGLAGLAGAAQGGQNTAFDQDALAGIIPSDDDDDNALSDNDDDDDDGFEAF